MLGFVFGDRLGTVKHGPNWSWIMSLILSATLVSLTLDRKVPPTWEWGFMVISCITQREGWQVFQGFGKNVYLCRLLRDWYDRCSWGHWRWRSFLVGSLLAKASGHSTSTIPKTHPSINLQSIPNQSSINPQSILNQSPSLYPQSSSIPRMTFWTMSHKAWHGSTELNACQQSILQSINQMLWPTTNWRPNNSLNSTQKYWSHFSFQFNSIQFDSIHIIQTTQPPSHPFVSSQSFNQSINQSSIHSLCFVPISFLLYSSSLFLFDTQLIR